MTTETLQNRVIFYSKSFLNKPYISNSLPQKATFEDLILRFDGFDCVTFVETVLALALSDTNDNVANTLRSLRYLNGIQTWNNRHHYMSQWIIHNSKAGFISELPDDILHKTGKNRILSILNDYPPIEWPEKWLKTEDLEIFVQPGDILCFVSQRQDLDVFHVGICVEDFGLIHASRSQEKVILDSLRRFVDRNKVPGVILGRPSRAIALNQV